MPWGAVIGAVGAIGAASIASDGAQSAADTQTNAANAANAQQRADQAPWLAAGGKAVGQLSTDTSPGGKYNTPFSMSMAQNSDAEKYAQSQAMQASQNSAAARGGLINTNENQALQTNAAGIASQYQNQAFNQWLQTNQQQLNAQQSLAGLGQSSASNVAQTGAALTTGAANAQAAAQVANGNIWGNAVGSLGGQMSTLGNLFGYGKNNTGNTIDSADQNYSFTSPSYADPNSGSGYSYPGDGNYSDERLKTHIKRVGTTDDGLPIYTYKMRGGDGNTEMGILAQDLEKVNPKAVKKDEHGFRMADYSKVH